MSKIRDALQHLRAAEALMEETMEEFPIGLDIYRIKKVMFEVCLKMVTKARRELEEWIEDNLIPEGDGANDSKG